MQSPSLTTSNFIAVEVGAEVADDLLIIILSSVMTLANRLSAIPENLAYALVARGADDGGWVYLSIVHLVLLSSNFLYANTIRHL